jgi:hypothetical protein
MWRNTDNRLRPRWRLVALIGLAPLLALARTAPPAQPFQRLDSCAYKPQRWDDGDSFHVILPDQKELIFRLYFFIPRVWRDLLPVPTRLGEQKSPAFDR